LLLIMLDYYSMLHFTVTHCASMLLIVLHCCSMFLFVTPTSMLLHPSLLFVLHCCSYFVSHVVSLSCGASLLLYASLFSCPPRYLFAPCCFVALLCFVVAQCVATPLFKLVFCPPPPPPRHPPFFTRFWKFEFEIDWEEARKHPSSKLPISFLCFLFSKLFFWFPFLDLVLGFYLLLFC
jgi:hypothetical protein